MYRTKEYRERQWEEIKTEVDLTSSAYPETRRIFLADGDALNLPTDKLIKIIKYLYSSFSNLERVVCYAMPKNSLQKSDFDLDKLREAGLGMMYLGIETGNDALLMKITKGATSKGILQACQKAKAHKFVLSCMVILGLGRSTYTKQHIDDTARLVSVVSRFLGGFEFAIRRRHIQGVYEKIW